MQSYEPRCPLGGQMDLQFSPKPSLCKLCAWRGSVQGQWHLRESTMKPLNREGSMEKEEREREKPHKQILKTFHSKLCLHTRIPKYMLRKTCNKINHWNVNFLKMKLILSNLRTSIDILSYTQKYIHTRKQNRKKCVKKK